eukprot:1464897-Rhodomonas_salina.1
MSSCPRTHDHQPLRAEVPNRTQPRHPQYKLPPSPHASICVLRTVLVNFHKLVPGPVQTVPSPAQSVPETALVSPRATPLAHVRR